MRSPVATWFHGLMPTAGFQPGRREATRTEGFIVRATGVLIVLALLLQSCTPSYVVPTAAPTLPSFQVTGSVSTIDAFTLGSVASNGATAIYPLFELPSIPTNQGALGLTVWGAKDGNGNITAVTQAEIAGLSNLGGSSVHVFFDAANLPVLFVDDASGYSIAVTAENTSQPVITLCDPNGTADATTTLTVSGGTAQTGTVTSGGSCTTSAVVTTARSRHADAEVETNVSSYGNIASLITAGSYVAGFAFVLGAILKFKAHKDNPTQIPVGTPIALIFIAAALLFLPTIISVSGATLFGSTALAPVDGLLPLYESTP
jgi:intracellular multiplication protein IcmD